MTEQNKHIPVEVKVTEDGVTLVMGDTSVPLTQRQFREIAEKAPRIIFDWDLPHIKAFIAARNGPDQKRYTPEYVAVIAAECGVEGIPFCSECGDWHTPDEEHTSDEGLT